MLNATEANAFRTTAISAYKGILLMGWVLDHEVRRAYRYLSSEKAIAIYRTAWTGFLITCCAMFWLGQQCRRLVQPIVDSIVADSLPVDAPALPTVEAEIRAAVQGYWEAIRVFLGVIGESFGIAIAILLNEVKQAIAGIMPGLA